MFWMILRNISFVLMNKGEMCLFMLFHMNSIGFRSGEYGGRNVSVIFSSLAVSRVLFAQCVLKLSSTITISRFGFCSRISFKNSQKLSVFESSLNPIWLAPFRA